MAVNSRFLVDTPLAGPGEYALGRQESHHAVNVLRHREGDAVVVFDGAGNYAESVIVDAHRDAVRVQVDSVRHEPHLPLFLDIATAIPKGKRWQTLVEKCTELGVDRIVPTIGERGVAKGEGDRGKWQRWMLEAAKQSRRAWLPEVVEPQPLSRVLADARAENSLLLLADPKGESPRHYLDLLRNSLRVTVLIGPEGGWSEKEQEACVAQGAQPVRLSPFILRIETAAAGICAIIREMLL